MMHYITAGALLVSTIAFVAVSGLVLAQETVTGNTESCISLARIKSTKIKDSTHILFELRGGKDMMSVLPHACPALKKWRGISYTTSLNKLCKQDIITVFEDDLVLGSCGLGPFHEVKNQVAEKQDQ